jgi:acyl-coenzyme A synthetase/AMP-(fatty) acid ligase
LTYAALSRHVEKTTAALAAGIGPGDTVAVVLRNSPEMAVCFLAVSSVAACAPLNPGYRASEFDFFLGDLRPKAVIVESGADSPVRSVATQHNIPLVEIGFRAGAEAGAFHLDPHQGAPSRPAAEDTALVLHTSGTTSRPKSGAAQPP